MRIDPEKAGAVCAHVFVWICVSLAIFLAPVFLTWGESGWNWSWFRISLFVGGVVFVAAHKEIFDDKK